MQALTKNWIVWTGVASAALAAAFVALSRGAAMPPDGGQTVYLLVQLYNYGALPASIVVLLAALSALFYWIPQALVKGPRYRRDGVWVAVALVAAVAAIAAALPLGRLIYRELASVSTPAGSVHLGVRVSGDSAQNAYVVCECPGLTCSCRYLFDESLAKLDPLPELAVDAAQRVTVQVAGRLLYAREP
ncbi:MAG: hypothetical protein JNK29_10030 [Anaerolineales bacterium]|nr:hypothetical protein [Anaerolineales bacterium]